MHSWSDDDDTDAEDLPRNHPDHVKYVSYTRAMLGSDAFYWFTIEAAGPDDIYYMSPSEIAQFRLVTR